MYPMHEPDSRVPYVLALLIVAVAVFFAVPFFSESPEQSDADHTALASGIVEWAVTFITFTLLSAFTFGEARKVFHKISHSQELKYSFFAFLIISMFVIAAIFRFGEEITMVIGEPTLWKLAASLAVGFAVLTVRRLPHFGDMLYASTLFLILGAIVFSSIGIGGRIFEIMVAFLVGILLHVAVINVMRVRGDADQAEPGEDGHAPVYPHKVETGKAKNRRASKSKAA